MSDTPTTGSSSAVEARMAQLESRVSKLESSQAGSAQSQPAGAYNVHYHYPCYAASPGMGQMGGPCTAMPPCVCGFSAQSQEAAASAPDTPAAEDFGKLGK